MFVYRLELTSAIIQGERLVHHPFICRKSSAIKQRQQQQHRWKLRSVFSFFFVFFFFVIEINKAKVPPRRASKWWNDFASLKSNKSTFDMTMIEYDLACFVRATRKRKPMSERRRRWVEMKIYAIEMKEATRENERNLKRNEDEQKGISSTTNRIHV